MVLGKDGEPLDLGESELGGKPEPEPEVHDATFPLRLPFRLGGTAQLNDPPPGGVPTPAAAASGGPPPDGVAAASVPTPGGEVPFVGANSDADNTVIAARDAARRNQAPYGFGSGILPPMRASGQGGATLQWGDEAAAISAADATAASAESTEIAAQTTIDDSESLAANGLRPESGDAAVSATIQGVTAETIASGIAGPEDPYARYQRLLDEALADARVSIGRDQDVDHILSDVVATIARDTPSAFVPQVKDVLTRMRRLSESAENKGLRHNAQIAADALVAVLDHYDGNIDDDQVKGSLLVLVVLGGLELAETAAYVHPGWAAGIKCVRIVALATLAYNERRSGR